MTLNFYKQDLATIPKKTIRSLSTDRVELDVAATYAVDGDGTTWQRRGNEHHNIEILLDGATAWRKKRRWLHLRDKERGVAALRPSGSAAGQSISAVIKKLLLMAMAIGRMKRGVGER
jgi:hypothetical protein